MLTSIKSIPVCFISMAIITATLHLPRVIQGLKAQMMRIDYAGTMWHKSIWDLTFKMIPPNLGNVIVLCASVCLALALSLGSQDESWDSPLVIVSAYTSERLFSCYLRKVVVALFFNSYLGWLVDLRWKIRGTRACDTTSAVYRSNRCIFAHLQNWMGYGVLRLCLLSSIVLSSCKRRFGHAFRASIDSCRIGLRQYHLYCGKNHHTHWKIQACIKDWISFVLSLLCILLVV